MLQLFSIFVATLATHVPADGASLTLRGGNVWNGRAFEERTLHIVDGLIVGTAPDAPVEELDASGMWLLPPLVEAHTHRYSSAYDARGARDAFLASGILYAANLCCPADAREQTQAFTGGENGVDMLFTGGALTASGGHPIRLYENLHSSVYRRPAETFWEDNNNSTFYVVDSSADLDVKWPLLLQAKPDLVKTMLSSSEEFEPRRDDSAYYGNKGLDPALLEQIVHRAHDSGLRVVTHVDTVADFRHALDAGVDLLAHTVGYVADSMEEWPNYALTEEDAERARRQGVVQITTAGLADSEAAREIVAHNLRLLRDHDVPLAIGSDVWEQAALTERHALIRLDVFSPTELVRMWCEDSARALFPDRSIGRLAPNYEGNLILLGANPLDDVEALADVRCVIKRGRVLYRKPVSKE